MAAMLDGSDSQLRLNKDQQQWRERQQFIALLVLFIMVSIILGALYLVQATTNVSTARDIQALRERRDRILRENEALRAENARLNGVPVLIERAATLGFVTAGPDDIQYLVVDGYVYDQPAPTLTPVLVTPTPQVYDDNFAGWLRRHLDRLSDLFARWEQE
jgi:cell division protein FtsB